MVLKALPQGSNLTVGRRSDHKDEVFFLCYRLEPLGGMELAALRLARSLALKYRVTILVLRGSDSSLPHVAHPFRILTGTSAIRALLALRRRGDPISLIVVGLWSAWALSLLPMSRRHRLIAWEHSLLPWRLSQDRSVQRIFRRALSTYNRASSVVCVTQPVARVILELGVTVPVSVIPNLIEPDPDALLRIASEEASVRLTTLGALRPVKNQRLALESIALLGPEFTLNIAGAGPSEPSLKQYATSLGIDDRVHFLGHVDEPRQLLARTDILVHPSLAETFAFSLFEAARFDIPVVTLDVEALTEVVPVLVAGCRVKDQSAAAFAKAIAEVAKWTSSEGNAFRVCRQERCRQLNEVDLIEAWEYQLFGGARHTR